MISTANIDPLLSKIAADALQDPEGFGGLKLFPLLHVGVMSAKYYILPEDNAVNVPTKIERAPGTGFSRSGTKLSDGQFRCRDYGHEELVSDEENGKYARKGAAIEAATRRSQNVILVNHELRAKAMATSATVPKAAVAVKWNDPASNPVSDVKAARQEVFDGCGLDANVMVVGRKVYEALKENPAIRAQIKISDGDSRWPKLLAVLFDVDEFVVAKARVNTAQEGQELDVSEVWGDSVIVARVDSSEDFEAPSFGRTFIFADETNLTGVTVSNYRDEKASSNVVRAKQLTDEKLTGLSAGFHLEDVLES